MLIATCDDLGEIYIFLHCLALRYAAVQANCYDPPVVFAAQGMGEGEGRKDVSDQLENEDQLLGAKRPDQPEEKVSLPFDHLE